MERGTFVGASGGRTVTGHGHFQFQNRQRAPQVIVSLGLATGSRGVPWYCGNNQRCLRSSHGDQGGDAHARTKLLLVFEGSKVL